MSSSRRQLSGRSRPSAARSRRLSRRVVVSGLALASVLAAVVLTVELQHQPTSGSPAEVIGTGCTLPPGQNCYSLQAFRNAYGISPLLARGIDGRGRTVVLVEWLASGAPPASNFAPSNCVGHGVRWCRGRHPRPQRTWP